MQRNLARSMRAIHHRQNVSSARPLADFLKRKTQSCRRGDMTDENHFCPGSYPLPEMIKHLLVIFKWERNGLVDISYSTLRAKKAPGTIRRAIFVIGCQHFIPRL